MLGTKRQQHQRQANVVIQIAARRQHRVFTHRSNQNAFQHFFNASLAVRAGNRDHRQFKLLPPIRRQRAQRQTGIRHRNQRRIRQTKISRYYRTDRTSGKGLCDKVMRIKTLATQRNK